MTLVLIDHSKLPGQDCGSEHGALTFLSSEILAEKKVELPSDSKMPSCDSLCDLFTSLLCGAT